MYLMPLTQQSTHAVVLCVVSRNIHTVKYVTNDILDYNTNIEIL